MHRGAGSTSVKLAHAAGEARALAERVFSSGSSAVPHLGKDALKRYRAINKHDLGTLATILNNREMMEVEKGYVYFKVSFRITALIHV
jgi:hypothetical protein